MKHPQTFPLQKGKPVKPSLVRSTRRAAAASTRFCIGRMCNFLLGGVGAASCTLLVAISLHTKSLGELFVWMAAILAAAGLFSYGLILVKRDAASLSESAPPLLPIGRKSRFRHPGRRRMRKKRRRRGNVISKRRNQKKKRIKY